MGEQIVLPSTNIEMIDMTETIHTVHVGVETMVTMGESIERMGMEGRSGQDIGGAAMEESTMRSSQGREPGRRANSQPGSWWKRGACALCSAGLSTQCAVGLWIVIRLFQIAQSCCK